MTLMRITGIVTFLAVLAVTATVCAPVAQAQNGCMPFYLPAGPESGNFITGYWYAEGPVFLGKEELYVKVSIWDNGDGRGLGKKGNTFKGTERALYDFGNGDTFSTTISYVVEHNNDPDKFYMNALENIVPGSGTGRFKGATGQIADHGPFGISNWVTMDGWAVFTAHGTICGTAR
jgi:hypothetical protein